MRNSLFKKGSKSDAYSICITELFSYEFKIWNMNRAGGVDGWKHDGI